MKGSDVVLIVVIIIILIIIGVIVYQRRTSYCGPIYGYIERDEQSLKNID